MLDHPLKAVDEKSQKYKEDIQLHAYGSMETAVRIQVIPVRTTATQHQLNYN